MALLFWFGGAPCADTAAGRALSTGEPTLALAGAPPPSLARRVYARQSPPLSPQSPPTLKAPPLSLSSQVGRDAEAAETLKRIRTSGEVSAELAEIRSEVQLTSGSSFEAVRELWTSKSLRRAAFLGIGLQLINQLSGINTVMYYSATILRSYAGFERAQAIWIALVCALAQFMGTIVSAFTMDYGRRRTMLRSAGLVIGSLVMLSGSFIGLTMVDDDASTLAAVLRALIVTFFMGYLVGFGAGFSAVPIVVCSEMYPIRVRSIAMSQALLVNWLANYLVSCTFLTVADTITMGGTFAIFAAIAIAGTVWVYFRMPETAGISLEQVERLFDDPYPQNLRTGYIRKRGPDESSRLVRR